MVYPSQRGQLRTLVHTVSRTFECPLRPENETPSVWMSVESWEIANRRIFCATARTFDLCTPLHTGGTYYLNVTGSAFGGVADRVPSGIA